MKTYVELGLAALLAVLVYEKPAFLVNMANSTLGIVVMIVTVAVLAKQFGIRVYTIGVGTEGYAPYPFQTPFGVQYQDVEVQIDEETLQNIATVTDGKYFRATNNSKLKEIYKDIDKLEKSKIEVTEFHKRSEEFSNFAIPAFIILLFGFIFEKTYLKQIL